MIWLVVEANPEKHCLDSPRPTSPTVRALEGPYGPYKGPRYTGPGPGLRAHLRTSGPHALRAHGPTTLLPYGPTTGPWAYRPDMTWTEPRKRGTHEILQDKIKGVRSVVMVMVVVMVTVMMMMVMMMMVMMMAVVLRMVVILKMITLRRMMKRMIMLMLQKMWRLMMLRMMKSREWKMMMLRMMMLRRTTDPKTGTHTLCEPAQSKCTWTCHKSREHFYAEL